MFRRLVLAVAIVGLIAVGLVGGQQAAEAQETASATRSFSPSEVEPDSRLVVTIRVADYGGIGQLTETFNSDFTFVSSSPQVTPSGQTLTFNLVGDRSVSYTLTAPTTPGRKTGFSGNLAPAEGDGVRVGGPSSVTVTTPPAQETASATRSFSPSEVEPDSRLVVTIRVADYGGIGQLTETFNSDFTFVSSSPQVTPSGQTLTFNLVGDRSVSYTLTAPTTPGRKTGFSGNLAPAEGDGVRVGGPSGVTVTTPPAQQTASANRSFSPSEVEPDSRLVVTISVAGYGGLGQLTETFHSDFTFVSSSPQVTPSGQTLTFNLVGDRSVSYTLTAPTTPGRKTGFSGNLAPAEGDGVRVGGPSSVTVRVVAPAPDPQVNRAPAFSLSSTTRTIVENLASGANVGAVVRATDADGDRLTYSLTGTDAGSFTINSGTGQIMVGAGTTLDYETKARYMVTVTATDPAGDSDSIAVTVMVTNVDEIGTLSGEASVSYVENDEDAVATYTASGAMADDAMWTVMGDDEAHFTITGGMLKFRSAPDYEMPRGMAMSDTNTNTYMVTVKAEAGGEMAMMEVTVMVTNVDELEMVSGEASVSYAENDEDAVATYTASGPMADDAMWTLMGDDAGDFSISSAGVLSFRSSPDFENPTDADMDNTYMVTVKAEAGGEMAMMDVTVTVTNEEETGEVTLWAGMDALTMAPQVGETITGAVMDPDGGVTGETWQWARTTTPDMMASWMDIAGETNADYMVAAGDTGHYLRVMATYTDAVGTDMDMEYSMPTMMVVAQAEDTLLAEYDANGNGQIDKSEVITAINDYLFGEVGIISKADVIRLINLYLFG